MTDGVSADLDESVCVSGILPAGTSMSSAVLSGRFPSEDSSPRKQAFNRSGEWR
jgi:hypothetical protein